MDFGMKIQIVFGLFGLLEGGLAALLRTPKVYNALITTDQNLTPSRAYPVIQPTLDAPFYYGPYGYNAFTPYGYYDPYGFSPFSGEESFVAKYNAAAAATASAASTTAATKQSETSARDTEKNIVSNAEATGSTEKSPIPVNEYGFPPSLIPLAPNQINPINLAPFAYNSYPLIYDHFGAYHQGAYLPHFGILPQHAVFGTAAAAIANENQRRNEVNAANDIKGGANIPNTNAHAGSEIGGPAPNQVFFDRQNGVSERPLPLGAGIGGNNAGYENGAGFANGFGSAAGGAAGIGGPGSSLGSTGGGFGDNNGFGSNAAAAAAYGGNYGNSGAYQGSAAAGGGGGGQSSQSGFQASQSSQGASSTTRSSESGSASGSSSSLSSSQSQSASVSGIQAQRSGRLLFNDSIKNNKNRNENIVDVPPPPVPFGFKTPNGTK